jgi:hypothetical protein
MNTVYDDSNDSRSVWNIGLRKNSLRRSEHRDSQRDAHTAHQV